MDMIKTNSFTEMSFDEMQTLDGGIVTVAAASVLAAIGKGALAAAGGWVVCKGLDHVYDAVGRKTGWW